MFCSHILFMSFLMRRVMTLRGGVGVGFSAPSTGYRFGIRLASFTSILSAELYSILCALKYILRMRFPSTVVFTDSLYALYHLRDGFFSTRTSPYEYKILHLLSFIQEQEFTVGFAWITSHAGIVGNEQTDYLARLSSRLPFTVNCGIPLADLLSALGQDNRAWCHGTVFCGLTRVHRLAVVIIILTEYLLKLLDHGLRATGFLGAISVWSRV